MTSEKIDMAKLMKEPGSLLTALEGSTSALEDETDKKEDQNVIDEY